LADAPARYGKILGTAGMKVNRELAEPGRAM
jgi:hypothetical protein